MKAGIFFSYKERRCAMKAGIFFTGTGPILILTSYESLDDPNLVEKSSQPKLIHSL